MSAAGMNATAIDAAASLHFTPLVPEPLLFALAAAAALAVALSFLFARRGALWRALALAAFLLVLSGPALREEKRESVPGIAAVILDESPSQSFGPRAAQAEKALKAIEAALGGLENIELRVAKAPTAGRMASRTELFRALEDLYGDVPENRRAGVFLITDGQVHDAPDPAALAGTHGPVHVLLTGERRESDRRMTLVEAPAFGIVGQDIAIRYKVEDSGDTARPDARVTLRQAGEAPQVFFVPPGEEQTLRLPVKHAGQNVFELSAEGLEGELTPVNNRAVIDVQGVRDRLRVLLVSGRPHAGGRTWRDILTSDPGVDLVHFTILREPDKIDATPTSEMSLIAFPFRELFEVRLYDFDLIIFDRYRLNRVLPDEYFGNIARYVQEGGAFLEVSGPDYAAENSIWRTALHAVLPGAPTGEVFSGLFTPQIAEKGRAHPVTRSLAWKTPEGEAQDQAETATPAWGPWLRQVGLDVRGGGEVLMTGNGGKPLLVLSRTGEGRIAQVASDQIWLWSRGYKGGGPHAELLRRLVHWLMKEPELDEKALSLSVNGSVISIRRPDYPAAQDSGRIAVTKPGGEREDITLAPDGKSGMLAHDLHAESPGIYGFETPDGESRFAVVGEANPPEFRDVLSTDSILKPLAEKTGGGLWRLEDSMPALRLLPGGGRMAGGNWAALQDNRAYIVTGSAEKPLLPFWIGMPLLLALTLLAWWREGRR